MLRKIGTACLYPKTHHFIAAAAAANKNGSFCKNFGLVTFIVLRFLIHKKTEAEDQAGTGYLNILNS